MTFTNISWLVPALKCMAVVGFMAALAVALSALGAWWMGRRKGKQKR